MIMSLWASAPVFAGGLGYATGEIGSILAITGAALIFFQILVYPSLNRCFGTLGLLRRLVLLQVLAKPDTLGFDVLKRLLEACLSAAAAVLVPAAAGELPRVVRRPAGQPVRLRVPCHRHCHRHPHRPGARHGGVLSSTLSRPPPAPPPPPPLRRWLRSLRSARRALR
jgi:hypothetical protein